MAERKADQVGPNEGHPGAPGGCDAEAIEAAFHEHYAGLCDFVAGYVRSREVAHDLVQDLFMALWQRCEAGDAPPLTPAYLYPAARNRALSELRHRRVVSRWEERKLREPVRHADAADEDVHARDLAQAIDRAIEQLPERCREVFLMSRDENLSYAEIAEALGVSVKTVETQIWRALKVLRSSVAPYLTVAIAPFAELGAHILR